MKGTFVNFLISLYISLSLIVVIRGAMSQTYGGEPRPICTVNQNWESLFYPALIIGCWLNKDPNEAKKKEAWMKADKAFLQQMDNVSSHQQKIYFCKPGKSRLGYRPTASVGYFEGSRACTKKEMDEIFSEKKK